MILYSIAPLVDVLVSHIACAQAGCLRTCKRKVKAKVMHRINDKFHTRGARASANTLLADLNINNWSKVEDHHKSLANGLPMRGGGSQLAVDATLVSSLPARGNQGHGEAYPEQKMWRGGCGHGGCGRRKVKVKVKVVVDMEVSGM